MEPPEKNCEIPLFQNRSEPRMFHKEISKITMMLENFVEKLVQKSYRRVLEAFFLFPAAVMTLVLSVEGCFDSSDTIGLKIDLKTIVLRLSPAIPIQMCILELIENKPRCNCEYRNHFTDIGSSGKKSIIAFNILIVFHFITVIFTGFNKWNLFTLIGLFIIQVLSVLIAFVNAQTAAKLRINPCSLNDCYTLTRTEIKDKGYVQIIESSVFKITLKNIGSEPWNSTNFVLHRHTSYSIESNGRCFRTLLPVFTLLPQEEIYLVPEGYEFEGECVRVPRLRCFGSTDRYNIVRTIILEAKGKYSSRTEEKEVGKYCSGNKIAEHVAKYKFTPPKVEPIPKPKKKVEDNSEWTNVTVF